MIYIFILSCICIIPVNLALKPENHTLFKNYENRIFKAFSHVSVVNDNYMILFKRILKKLRMSEFLESLIELKIKIIKMVIPLMSV